MNHANPQFIFRIPPTLPSMNHANRHRMRYFPDEFIFDFVMIFLVIFEGARYIYTMQKNMVTVKSESGEVIGKVSMDVVRFEMISDRLDYNWALWEVSVVMPDGDTITGWMEACPFHPELLYDLSIQAE